MPSDPLSEYRRGIEGNLNAGNATEHTHRPALRKLIEAVAKMRVTATNEPAHVQCGAPDFAVAAALFLMIACVQNGTCAAVALRQEVTVTLDPNVKYQTLRGWSANPYYPGASRRQRDQVLDDAVNELGLTRLRWQQPNGNRAEMRRWEWLNDNGDPDETDDSKLNTAHADEHIARYILPFKKRVEANGDPFELWLSPSFFVGGSTGPVPAWLLHSPGEYAEHAVSFILYLKKKYDIDTSHYAICNEAGNHNAFTPSVVAEMTKVLGARIEALGLPTKGQFSDGINASVTWRYIQAAKNDPDVWKYVDVLSYHWYGRDNQQYMDKIRGLARQKGMDTAQTEFMWLTTNHLYDDLTIGGVSYWSIYGLGGPSPRGQNYHFHLNGTSFGRGRQFWNSRQVMHYVRPGAVRIEVKSSDPALRALAFDHHTRVTLVLIAKAPFPKSRGKGPRPAAPPGCTVTVHGLPSGKYGVSQSVHDRAYQELGLRTVSETGTLKIAVPSDAVLTVYPHPGGNLPPTFVAWQAKPNYLKSPASKVVLSASAQDPELDDLSYSWSMVSQPDGAHVALTAPSATATQANGLTVPGEYVFAVTVNDGTNSVRREIALNVFRGNQPPMPIDVHNRIPVVVTLPQSTTELRGGAFDLEGDKLMFKWTVVRQPQGGAVKLETPTQRKCKLSNIAVAGDHVFRFEVRDGAHAVARELTVPVYPANAAPVIESARASPAILALPDAETSLSVRASDPDGDVVTHWWRVKWRPPGTKPVFSKQGGRDTEVTGLAVAGLYVFSVTVVDRTKHATEDVAVTVNPRGGTAKPAEGYSDPPAERARDGRGIIARGTTVGAVTKKGRKWIEIRSDSGNVARYIPRWIGDAPKDGGGPEKRMLAVISGLRAGDRVGVKWQVDHHLRLVDVQPE